MPIVYLAHCKATGKSYVGCTSRSLPQRREEHTVSAVNGSPHKFHRALREHGPSSFVWSVLATCASVEDMYRLERTYVERYNSFRSGYNSTPGGKGSEADGRASRRKMPIRPHRSYNRR